MQGFRSKAVLWPYYYRCSSEIKENRNLYNFYSSIFVNGEKILTIKWSMGWGRGRYGLLGEYCTRTVRAIIDAVQWGLPKNFCAFIQQTHLHMSSM